MLPFSSLSRVLLESFIYVVILIGWGRILTLYHVLWLPHYANIGISHLPIWLRSFLLSPLPETD